MEPVTTAVTPVTSGTRWNHYLAYFFGGVFLANTLPHLGNGVSGHPFQSPFASPPGEGLSSAIVNVVWAFANLVLAYLLVCRVGDFSLRTTRHVVAFGAGRAPDLAPGRLPLRAIPRRELTATVAGASTVG